MSVRVLGVLGSENGIFSLKFPMQLHHSALLPFPIWKSFLLHLQRDLCCWAVCISLPVALNISSGALWTGFGRNSKRKTLIVRRMTRMKRGNTMRSQVLHFDLLCNAAHSLCAYLFCTWTCRARILLLYFHLVAYHMSVRAPARAHATCPYYYDTNTLPRPEHLFPRLCIMNGALTPMFCFVVVVVCCCWCCCVICLWFAEGEGESQSQRNSSDKAIRSPRSSSENSTSVVVKEDWCPNLDGIVSVAFVCLLLLDHCYYYFVTLIVTIRLYELVNIIIHS